MIELKDLIPPPFNNFGRSSESINREQALFGQAERLPIIAGNVGHMAEVIAAVLPFASSEQSLTGEVQLVNDEGQPTVDALDAVTDRRYKAQSHITEAAHQANKAADARATIDEIHTPPVVKVITAPEATLYERDHRSLGNVA